MPKEFNKEEIDSRVKGYSNDKLLTETLYLAGGDDWEGCFTPEGQYEYDVLKLELERRLMEIGFLK